MSVHDITIIIIIIIYWARSST